MAGKRKQANQKSRAFLKRLPQARTREIDRFIRESKGKISQRVFNAIRGRQAALEHTKQADKRTRSAVKHFRPRKADRGKIVLITTEGKRGPKRKAVAVYVTKTGKKWRLTKKAERIRDVTFSPRRNLSKATREFETAKLVRVASGRSIKRGGGTIKAGGAHDFNQKVVGKIANSLKKVFDGQAGQRSFLIEVAALVKHPDGTTSTQFFNLPIDRADNVAVKLGGLRNFVEQKFYRALAQSLAYAGFVTVGSANHIRRVMGLEPGEELTEEIWTEYHNEAGHNLDWTAPRFEVVNIQNLEWKISQAK